MMLQVLDSINDPGTPGKSGDDRYGFDDAAGRAWVIDGATDATDLKPFPGAESGAAWLAEAVSGRLISGPEGAEGAKAYFGRVLTDVATEAKRVSRVPIASLPGEAMPVASMMWLRRDGKDTEFVWSGDCFAIAETRRGAQLVGTQEKADAETRDAARMLAMTQDERWSLLQDQRRAAGTPERGLVSLNPASAQHMSTQRLTLTPGAHVLLMTDGFFRFVEPYGLDTPASLLARALKDGLGGALSALRRHEEAPHKVRLKKRDDAAAILLRV